MNLYGKNGLYSILDSAEYTAREQQLVDERTRKDDPTTKRERALMAWWRRERIKPASNWWRPYYLKIQEALHYFQSETWVYMDGNQIVNPVEFENGIEPNYPRRNVNIFGRLINAIAARLLAERAKPMAVAGGGGYSKHINKQKARVANYALWHIDEYNNAEEVDLRVAKLQTLTGLAWLYSWFDDRQPGRVKLDKNQFQTVATGQVMYDVISPMNIMYNPETNPRFITWLVHHEKRSLGWVEMNYDRGQFVLPKSAENRDERIWPETLAKRGVPAPSRNEKDRSSTDVEIYNTYALEWDAEKRVSKWWRFAFCEDTTLIGPEVITDLPYTAIAFDYSDINWMPHTIAFELVNLQRELDAAVRGYCYRRKLHNFAKPAFPEGELPEADWDNDSGIPIELPVDSRTGQLIKPDWIVPPHFDSQGITQSIQETIGYMREVAGIHETSSGIIDTNITSGKHAETAAQQDTQNLQRPVIYLREGRAKHAMKMLQIADEKWPENMLLEITGRNGESDVEAFEKSLSTSITRVRMQQISRIPMEPASRRQFVMELTGMGVLNGTPEANEQLRRIMMYLEMDQALEDEIDAAAVARGQALNENKRLELGENVDVKPFEFFEIHMEIHREEINAPDFADKPELVRNVYIAHFKLTEQKKHERDLDDAMKKGQIQVALAGQPAGAGMGGGAPVDMPAAG